MITLPTLFAAGVLLTATLPTVAAQESLSEEVLAHTHTEFSFTAHASFERTAPLFGADEERKWAPDWNPKFIYPVPAHDQQGMIFQVAHGELTSTWVNTAFDLSGGHFQYAYVLANTMVTLIDIHLTRDGQHKTSVNVVYERTALSPEANEHVRHFAKGDQKAEAEWEKQINGYFEKLRAADQK